MGLKKGLPEFLVEADLILGIDFGIHLQRHPFLWKTMTSRKKQTYGNPGKTGHPDNIPDGNREKWDMWDIQGYPEIVESKIFKKKTRL